MTVYLDYNASALIRPEVQALVTQIMAEGGNPNAVHARGRRARAHIETARARVADLVGVDTSAVIFSSGGTESNAQALASAIAAGCERLIVSATEHPCVAETAAMSSVPVETLPVDANGQVDLEWLAGALKRPGRAMVGIHHANNESGVLQPIAEARALVAAADGWLHVDAIQSAGKIAVSMADLAADSLTLSGHKLGGLQGVGALVLAPGRSAVRILHGAGQERGLRAGTENVPGIAAFGVAAECAARDLAHDHSAWRDAAAERLKAEGAVVVGEGAPRLPNTLFVATDGWDSPQQLISLDLKGVMVSAGSACSSGKTKPSKTMVAMGLEPLATFAIRVSGGWGTVESDWQTFADAWCEARARLRARQPVGEIA
ncbi:MULTISPECIES: cysteine desulfurase family protein [unclassified Brevundimonas]|jgi:cysteine desulfurase|uniref:cysteine desulfurase family protein n=1 Tax=unclassified Brevundimonas TaxID=2622653 RepID=UPI000C3D889A|nr:MULTISPECIES: cysteine desulfurase family protein [unclassified Brevundimonas]MAL87502.1 aminotransferase [Brevundimonas sp.]HAV50490.1 cysteine desulfurase [Brevundimonas sp.]|tara:strand:+ start:36053 stop:37177 length:1125 start_codon:yes stop_codon:yes gene_type:complete